jgi:hypothetical protein
VLVSLVASVIALLALCPMALAAPSHAKLPALTKSPATGTGDLESGSTVIANVATTTGTFSVGQTITAPSGIPAATTIVAVAEGEHKLTLSAAATATVPGSALTGASFFAAKPCGVATDSVGDLYVSEFSGNHVKIYGPTGTKLTEFSSTFACSLAVDGAGRVYVNGTTAGVARYKLKSPFTYPPAAGAEYELDTSINGTGTLANGGGGTVNAVGVDPSNNRAVVSEGAGSEIQEYTIPTSERFALKFNGQSTGATGQGTLTPSSASVTGVSTSSGAFTKGEVIEGSGIVPGTTISSCSPSCGTAATAITLSQATEAVVPGPPTPLSVSFSESYPIGFSTNASLQEALRALSTINGANVTVANGTPGTRKKLTFSGTLANQDLQCVEVIKVGGNECAFQIFNGSAVSHISTYEPNGSRVTGLIGSGVSGATYYGVDAFGANGRIYATDKAHSKAYVFTSSGTTPLIAIEGTEVPGGFGTWSAATPTLAVNQSNGNVLINDITAHAAVDEFNAAGKFIDQITRPSEAFVDSAPSDIAVDSSAVNSGDVYISSGTTGATASVYAYGPLLPKPTLTTSVSPPGSGTVLCNGSEPANTWAACASEYSEGSSIALDAVPAEGFAFKEWKNGTGSAAVCNGSTNPICTIELNSNSTIETEFKTTGSKLTVTKAGTGTGTVTSDKSGTNGKSINCGTECEETFTEGTPVKLTGTSGANSKAVIWGGCDAVNGSNECEVTMSAAKGVTATFDLVKRTLTVTKAGTGAGTVTSSPAGINCGATCSAEFDHGTPVKLAGTSGANSKAVVWGGCDAVNGSNECEVTMSAAKGVTATFDLVKRTLTVTKAGTGAGTVTSSPAGINCGATCSAEFDHGTPVKLTGTPAANSKAVVWGGCDAVNGSNECEVTMSAAKGVTATFSLASRTLTIAKAGNGNGTFECKLNTGSFGACSSSYTDGDTIVIKANHDSHSGFTSWAGCSSATGSECTVSAINANTTVTASFSLNPHQLTVTRTGTGTGSVISTPAGINCGATCSTSFDGNAMVTLTAVPGPNAKAVAWTSGCDSVNSLKQCIVTMSDEKEVVASFEKELRTLTVTKSGNGSGTVTSSSGGVDCGSTCGPVAFDKGASVTLTAHPASGSSFVGWSGGGCSGNGSCTVGLESNTAVAAVFTVDTVSPTCANTPSLCPPASNIIFLGEARAKGKAILLGVTVPGPGTLAASGKNLVKSNGSASGAGTMTLKLKLTAAGIKQLQKKGKVTVKVKVVFTPAGGSPGTWTKTVTFKKK